MGKLVAGVILFFIGIVIICYEYNIRQKTKDYKVKVFYSPRGYVAGLTSVAVGLFLIFESINNKY